jgi:phage baseplate assembly protein W
MDAARLYGRGIAFPPRVGPDGRLAWSAGEDNVRESIQIILLTGLQQRIQRPDFGGSLNDFLFEPNTVTIRHALGERIRSTLRQWEPRIQVESVVVDADPSDGQAALATIVYRLVATGRRERVSLSVALSG